VKDKVFWKNELINNKPVICETTDLQKTDILVINRFKTIQSRLC